MLIHQLRFLTLALNRPDGSDLLILSPHMLHILDKCFWCLPFAIRSDVVTAIKNAGASLAMRLGFLNALLAEHAPPPARAELKRLWAQWIEKTYEDGLVSTPLQTGAVAAPAARLSMGQAETPSDSPRGSD